MKTTLNVVKIDKNKYEFTLTFENNESGRIELPIDRLENSAEMVGFHFEINDERLEPIEFRIVSKENYNKVMVEPDKTVSVKFIGSLEKRGEKYYCLSFKNAGYQVVPREKYKAWFSLNGYVSNEVELRFEHEQTNFD